MQTDSLAVVGSIGDVSSDFDVDYTDGGTDAGIDHRQHYHLHLVRWKVKG